MQVILIAHSAILIWNPFSYDWCSYFKSTSFFVLFLNLTLEALQILRYEIFEYFRKYHNQSLLISMPFSIGQSLIFKDFYLVDELKKEASANCHQSVVVCLL